MAFEPTWLVMLIASCQSTTTAAAIFQFYAFKYVSFAELGTSFMCYSSLVPSQAHTNHTNNIIMVTLVNFLDSRIQNFG